MVKGVVVNVGGLRNYVIRGVDSGLVDNAVEAYLNLVLFSARERIASRWPKGFRCMWQSEP